MKKLILKAAVLAVAMAAPSIAFAVNPITMATGSGQTGAGAFTYAKEMITNGVLGTPATGTAITDNNLDLSGTLGFGVSNGQTRYIRFDLTNATLNLATTALDLAVDALGTPASVALVQGGAQGDTYAIFQITANADYAANATVDFGLSNGGGTADGIKVLSKNSSASITYSLYEFGGDAVTGGAGGRLAIQSGVLANFATSLNLTATQNTTTADVTTLYKNFKASTGFVDITNSNIGDVTFGVVAANKTPAGVGVAIGDLVAAGTKLVVTGTDLSASATSTNKMYLDADGTCNADFAGVGVAGSGQTATTVDLVVDAVVTAGNAVCFNANGTTPIIAQTFTVGAVVVPAAGTDTVAPTTVTLGAFDRDGTILKAPFTNNRAGQATFVQLANTSSVNDAPFTTRCFGTTGTITTGTAGQVDKGETLLLSKSALGCGSGAVNAVEFTLAVPQGTVIGATVRQNNTTGDSAIDSLTGNQ